MKKKFYSVNCHYDMVVSVDVVAESEEEAIEKAKGIADNVNIGEFGEYSGNISACITDKQELTDELQRRIDQQATIFFT